MHAGVAPIPASSGRTTRHRLARGGNRQLNAALHRIAVTQTRLPAGPGQVYYQRRRAQETPPWKPYAPSNAASPAPCSTSCNPPPQQPPATDRPPLDIGATNGPLAERERGRSGALATANAAPRLCALTGGTSTGQRWPTDRSAAALVLPVGPTSSKLAWWSRRWGYQETRRWRADGGDPDSGPAATGVRELDAGRVGRRAAGGGPGDRGAATHAGDVRAGGAAASAAGGVPRRTWRRATSSSGCTGSSTAGSGRAWRSPGWRTSSSCRGPCLGCCTSRSRRRSVSLDWPS